MWLEILFALLVCTILYRHLRWYQDRNVKQEIPASTMIILGSGGHTREILSLTHSLPQALYSPRFYVYSKNDHLSKAKASQLEKDRHANDFSCWRIFRSREVAQSWWTSIFTTMISCFNSVFLICYLRPDLILCNGPGVCVPLCVVAFVMKVLGLFRVKIVYVESVCRLHRLSLTGKILRYIADEFLVQWRHMAVQFPFTKYIGRIS